MNGHDIVALGDVNMDYVVAGSLSFELSSLVGNGCICWEDVDEVPGGSALNFCTFAAEAGYDCLLLGKAGDDTAGPAVTTWLKERSIALPRRWTVAAPTGRALILRDSAGIRLIINNRRNANEALSVEDVEENETTLMSCGVLYVSGYCIGNPGTPRHLAAVRAMEAAHSASRPPTIVFDVVPHRIHELLTFDQFRESTRHVDVLISEVATVRRFLRLGSVGEAIDEAVAWDTARRITRYYRRAMLRYGPSGCDEEILIDVDAGQTVRHTTGHGEAIDKRGYGDRLALNALRDFFHVLPVR
jgi:sugar/nucleoside kinase (ribokinase family)